MKYYLILWVLLVFRLTSSAFQPPGADGLAKYSSRLDGETADNEIVYDMAADDSGNVYIVGSFASPELRISVNKEVDLENPTGTLTPTHVLSDSNHSIPNPERKTDVFITKYDSSGNVLWVRTAGGTGNDHGTGVALDDAGNVYITGHITGAATFGAISLDPADAYLGGNTGGSFALRQNVFVAMLDSGGSWQWARQLEYEMNHYEEWEKVIYLNFEANPNSFPTPPGYVRHVDRSFRGGEEGLSYGFLQPRSGFLFADSFETSNPVADPRLNSWVVFQNEKSGDDISSNWRLSGLEPSTYRLRFHGRNETNGAHVYADGNKLGVLPLGNNQFKTFIADVESEVRVLGGYTGNADSLPRGQLNEFDYIQIDKMTSAPVLFPRDVSGNLVINSGRNSEMGKAIAIDADRNIYIKGHFAGDNSIRSEMPEATDQFEYELRLKVGDSVVPVASHAGTARLATFVVKLENNTVTGDPVPEDWDWDWVRAVSTSSPDAGADFPRVCSESTLGALETNDNGDLFVTGNWSDDLVLGADVPQASMGADREAFVARLSPAGDRLALGRISGGADPLPVDLTLDNQGGVFVAGNFSRWDAPAGGDLSFRNERGTTESHRVSQISNFREAFIAKMNVAGSWQWARKVGTVASNDDVIAHGIGRDASGSLYFTGAFINGPLKLEPAVSSVGKPNPNTANAFIAKLSPSNAGWEGFVQSPAIIDGTQNLNAAFHGVDVINGPGGTMFWLVSTGVRRHSSGNPNSETDALSGVTRSFNSDRIRVSDRLPDGASEPDTSRGMAGFLFPINTDLEALPAFFVKSGFFAGEEISPPGGVYLDAGGFPLQPEIVIGGDATADSSAFFYWDAFAKRLFAVSETLQATEIKWRVTNDPADLNRITVETGVQWPNTADTDRYQQHVTGSGPDFDLPHVELQPSGLAHTFVRPLYSDAGNVFGNKLFKASSGWSTLLYIEGQNAPEGTGPATLVVVRSSHYASALEAANVPATIGDAIDGAPFGHNSLDGRNGFVATERARYDSTGANAVYNRELRIGPIIPVNESEPTRDSETELTIIWYAPDDKELGVPWPVKAVNYAPHWPVDSEVITITSALGSDVVVDDGAYHFEQEELLPSKFTSIEIYQQSDKNQPGYNPNEEHAVIAQGQRRNSPAVFALRNDLNHLNPSDALYRTSDPYVLLKYRDATDGSKWKFKVYRVELTHQYDPAEPATLFDFNDFTGHAGNQVQPPWPLSNLASSTLTFGEGSAYWEDVHGTVWARSAGTIDAFYYYPLQPGFWWDEDGNGEADPNVFEVPWLNRVTTDISPSNGTPLSDPVRIGYAISWPPDPPVLRIGDSFTAAKDGLPDVINQAATAIIFDENEPNVGHTDASIAATGDPKNTLVRLYDSQSSRRVPYGETLNALLLDNGQGSGIPVQLADAGLYQFKFLSFDLKARLFYDPVTKEIFWKGAMVNGGTVELINVMTSRERDLLKAFDADVGSAWDAAIDALYQKTRNPNEIDVDGTPGADPDLLIGLNIDTNGNLAFDNVFAGKTVSAGLGLGEGWVVLAENNDTDPAIFAQQVNVHVFRVEGPQVPGHVNVIQSDSVFDTAVSVRHSADFAGDPDHLFFEWWYHDDSAGRPDSVPPEAGWQLLAPETLGLNQISISDSGVRSLSDGWIYCRYRGQQSPWNTAYPDSNTVYNLAGDPATRTLPHRPQLFKGWIKRVIEELDPFETRVKEFHSTPTQTYVGMVQQAGARYEGDIAFNGDPSNVNQVGLIELYDTLLRFGSRLSIDGTPQVNHPGANNALLLAATRLSDFFMLLGNESYGDALDPTIGFNFSGGPDFGTLSGSVFAFQNQLPNLIEEELALLRGRNDVTDGVQGAPIYNRLFWNFTNGLEGEPAYVNNYNVTDQNADGFVDETDARILFPQGHGDAWGHYLSALKSFYRLLRHPFYTREPRTENTTVAGVPITVLYEAERKFAIAAATRVKAGAEIVDLEYRNRYVADPNGQYQGYKDTDEDRAWGVDGWARRTGQAAVFDWAMANALLPEESSNTTALEKIDRVSIGDLHEIGTALLQVQAQMDEADQGRNPLGLTNNTIPFDINPSQVVTTNPAGPKTHFEQIYERAQKAVDNANSVYDHANKLTSRLRKLQLDANDFAQEGLEQELEYKNRLIEIFGYPYSGDIGPTGIYPDGYDGPDLIKYNYVGLTEISSETVPAPSATLTGFFESLEFETVGVDSLNPRKQLIGLVFPNDVPNPNALVGGLHEVEFPILTPDQRGASSWAFTATPEMGFRRAGGRIQSAIGAAVQAEIELKKASQDYENLVTKIIDAAEILQARFNRRQNQLEISQNEAVRRYSLDAAILGMKAFIKVTNTTKEDITGLASAVVEGIPKVVGFATDATSSARGALKASAVVAGVGLNVAGVVADSVKGQFEQMRSELKSYSDSDIAKVNFAFEVQQQLKNVEHLLIDETNARLKVLQATQKLKAARGGYNKVLAEGQRLIEERLVYRRKVAGDTQVNRYQDIAFRNFRNDALQKYRAAFDLAQSYVYLAAQAYDYETNLQGSQNGAGRRFLQDIVRERALGQFIDGVPINGVNGLSDPMARMTQNFDVFKGQLGFNNPQVETGRFSLRRELFRIGDSNDALWAKTLQDHRVQNLWQIPEFRRFCRPFIQESSGEQPGLVIPFTSTVSSGFNFFGWPLAGGDSSYDSSNFATKIRSAGVWFDNYNGQGLALTPRVYLVPAGADVMRSPNDDSLEIREFRILDQRIPEPFPIGANSLTQSDWIPRNDSVSGEIAEIRRFNRFRAFHDSGFDLSQMTSDSRLIGRSVWNTRWMLIIPGATFLNDPDAGLETFINGQLIPGTTQRDGNGIKDIKLFFETYAYSGL